MEKPKDIFLYNTKTKSLQNLSPIQPPIVKVYSCGPTVYDEAHIGNLRAFVFADTLHRTLINSKYKVQHIINITDVGHLTDDGDDGEDKIEQQAIEKNKNPKEISEYYTSIFLKDIKKLNINTKEYAFPKATEYINEQIELIKRIEKEGLTYEIKDGIYFDTQKYTKYGALGLTSTEDGGQARIQQNKEKKHPNDFALWKITPKDTKRKQEWNSPWGLGFPGWHIECSAMAMKLLGEQIDIHTGGIDHITVHHNNEIAQSESVTQKTFSNIWMHSAFLTMKNEKLSKSLNNSFTLTELENKNYHPLSLRYLFLQANYRSELHFSLEQLQASQTALNRLQRFYNSLPQQSILSSITNIFSNKKETPADQNTNTHQYTKNIDEAMADDLNTAKVIAIIHDIMHDTTIQDKEKRTLIKYANSFLGILSHTKTKYEKEMPDNIKTLIEERDQARKEKDYKTSDAIREQLEKMGYEVKDTEKGTQIKNTT